MAKTAKAFITLAVVALASVLSLVAYSYLPSQLPQLPGLPRQSHGVGSWSLGNINVIDVRPKHVDPSNWFCEWSVNESHIVYRCRGRQEWVMIASVGGDVRELNVLDLREAGVSAPATIEFSVTKVVDLDVMKSWVVVEAGTEVMGLGRFKREYVNEVFYSWVTVVEPGYWALDYVGNRTFKAYMTFITYEEVNDTLRYYPMERERAGEYLRYASVYSKLMEELIGVRIVFEYVEPEKVCIGLPEERSRWIDTRKHGYRSFTCDDSYRDLPLLKVVETPYDLGGVGGFYRDRWIYVRYKDAYGTFVHELGHALGLVDVVDAAEAHRCEIRGADCIRLYTPTDVDFYYLSIMSYSFPETYVTMWVGDRALEILRNSTWPRATVSLGDFAMLATRAYWFIADYEGRGSPNAMAVLERLVSIGVNPYNLTVLLPVVIGSRIAYGLDELVRQGLLVVDWQNPENSRLNEGLLRALQLVARESGVTVKDIYTPEETGEGGGEPKTGKELPPWIPRTKVYASLGETVEVGPVKITVLGFKEAKYVKYEWGSIYKTIPVRVSPYHYARSRIVIFTIRIEGVRHLNFYDLYYTTGWIYLKAVSVEHGVVTWHDYDPVGSYYWLELVQNPWAYEKDAVPVRDLLRAIRNALTTESDVAEGDVLFVVAEGHIPARLLIRLMGTMIYVNLNPSFQLHS